MNEALSDSVFLGSFLTVAAYCLGSRIQKKSGKAWLNPILLSALMIIFLLLALRIDYQTYLSGAKYVQFLLTPATVCLAVPMYDQLQILKKNGLEVVLGIASGTVASLLSILLFSILFGFTHEQYVTFLPKSITSAMGIELSRESGGYASLTAAVIIITGVLGNLSAAAVCRVFRIANPIAKGVAIGTSSHAIGTSKALKMGQVEGAMSSLSVVIAGLLTTVLYVLFIRFYP